MSSQVVVGPVSLQPQFIVYVAYFWCALHQYVVHAMMHPVVGCRCGPFPQVAWVHVSDALHYLPNPQGE